MGLEFNLHWNCKKDLGYNFFFFLPSRTIGFILLIHLSSELIQTFLCYLQLKETNLATGFRKLDVCVELDDFGGLLFKLLVCYYADSKLTEAYLPSCLSEHF
jgi:hypothetical protein